MRSNGILMTSLLVAVALSGCLGDDEPQTDDLQSVECPDVHHHEEDHGDEAGDEDAGALDDVNATLRAATLREADGDALDATDALADCPEHEEEPAEPNLPPVAGLSMVADDGTVQDGTNYVLVGQSVTFSAAGSTDDDAIQLAALTVTDANGTRTVQLYDAETEAFVDTLLAFEHAGPANVTLRVLDDEGAVDLLETMLYVNRLHQLTISVDVPVPAAVHSTEECTYPTEGTNLVWQRSMNQAKFVVDAGAQWIEATLTGGTGEFTLCGPDGSPLTDASTDTASTERGAGGLAANPQYGVFGMLTDGTDALTFDVMVHYEP